MKNKIKIERIEVAHWGDLEVRVIYFTDEEGDQMVALVDSFLSAEMVISAFERGEILAVYSQDYWEAEE